MNDRTLLLKVGVITEGALCLLSLLLMYLFDIPVLLTFSLESLSHSAFPLLTLLAFNLLIFVALARFPRFEAYNRFMREVVYPLCSRLNWPQAVLLGLLAGFAEEFFFRGVLHRCLLLYLPLVPSCIITAAMFAYLHFVGSTRRYAAIVLLYFMIGLWFSLLTLQWGLEVAIIVHCLYDIIVLLLLRYGSAGHFLVSCCPELDRN